MIKLKIFPDRPQLADQSSKLWEEEFLDGLKMTKYSPSPKRNELPFFLVLPGKTVTNPNRTNEI